MIGHKFFSMMIVFTMFFQGGMIPTYLVVKSYGAAGYHLGRDSARRRVHLEFYRHAQLL